MPRAALDHGIELEYDTFGSADDPALLLVMGLNSQMIAWDERFCRTLASAGRHVIRYDNRDCGLSTRLDDARVDVMAVVTALMAGTEPPPIPYTLSDMALDAVGLLDHLGIERAHVVGASMGGMIAQTMVIEHPRRIHTLTSIMSTVGDPAFGQPHPEAVQVLLRPPATSRDAVIAASAQFAVWRSKRWFDPEVARRDAAIHYDRSFYPPGAARHLAAAVGSGDRTERLRSVTTPTLVIHGLDDTLIDPSGGRRTAELIPGAHLLEVADMGHDLPEPLWPLIIAAIVAHGESAALGSAEVAA
jgi:pimeloyl-ACP methyl ester carboxylesterase